MVKDPLFKLEVVSPMLLQSIERILSKGVTRLASSLNK